MQRLFIEGDADTEMIELRDACIARIAENRDNLSVILRIIWESGFDNGVLAERPPNAELQRKWKAKKVPHSAEEVERRFDLPKGMLANIRNAITHESFSESFGPLGDE